MQRANSFQKIGKTILYSGVKRYEKSNKYRRHMLKTALREASKKDRKIDLKKLVMCPKGGMDFQSTEQVCSVPAVKR